MGTTDRDALVTRYADYARALALDVAKQFPRHLPRADMVAAGHVGLIEAAERYDATKGAQFKTFAYYRVRGAVMDWARRSAHEDPRVRARASEQAALDAISEEARAHIPRGVADGAADAASLLSDMIDAAAQVFTVAECAQALASHDDFEAPDLVAQRREELVVIRERLANLPEKERTMIELVYFEGRTIEEAGQTFGLSKSWASRLHARALKLLRREVGEE